MPKKYRTKNTVMMFFAMIVFLGVAIMIGAGISSWLDGREPDIKDERPDIVPVNTNASINITNVSYNVQNNMFSADVELLYPGNNTTLNDFDIFAIVYDKVDGEWVETHFTLYEFEMSQGSKVETLTDVINVDDGFHLIRLELWDRIDVPNMSTIEDIWESSVDVNQGRLREWKIIGEWP